MWQYCWAHVVFHLMRWFPRNNRMKVRILILVFTLALLIPQVIVLTMPHTDRYCSQPLLEFLIVSIVFTFCMIGFSVLFSIMDPVPWEVKLGFHIFGVATFIVGLLYLVFTSQAEQCRVYTEQLYYFSVAVTIFSLVAIAFFLVTVPFWVLNEIKKNSVLDLRNRDGVCYEAVRCCSCVWHV